MSDKERGIYDKYIVNRVYGGQRKGEKHHNCRYFVLDLTHDKHAIPAIFAYASSCEVDGYHELAKDLRCSVGGEPISSIDHFQREGMLADAIAQRDKWRTAHSEAEYKFASAIARAEAAEFGLEVECKVSTDYRNQRDHAEAQLAALRKEAAEAIWQAYKEGCNDGVFNENDHTGKPGRFWYDSTARRAAQRIGGAE